jgi:hypothetical protein
VRAVVRHAVHALDACAYAQQYRLVVSFGIACIGCLAAALLALPAIAGTNSWTAIGPVA